MVLGRARRRCRRARRSRRRRASWLSTRPPTRSRASSTTTEWPLASSSRAAVSPAKPAPTTTTSALARRRLRRCGLRRRGVRRRRGAGGGRAPAPAQRAGATTSPRDGWSRHRAGDPISMSRSLRSTIRARCGCADQRRRQVAAACRRLAAEGSCSGPPATSAPATATLSRSRRPAPCSPSSSPTQVTVVDLDGRAASTASSSRPRSSTCTSASTALRRRRGRAHPRADGDRAVAACSTSSRCVHYEMLLLGGAVRVAPYATFGTPELADVGARGARGPHRGADGQPRRDHLRRPTSTAAVERALLLEWACTVYWRAAAIGEPRVLDDASSAGGDRRGARSAATARPQATATT